MWKEVGISGGSGLAVGAVDQLVQSWDDNRSMETKAKTGKNINPLLLGGTYLNYLLPAIVAGVVGFDAKRMSPDMQVRLLSNAGQLAGRKLTMFGQDYVAAHTTASWHEYKGDPAHFDVYKNRPNPQPIQTSPSTPTVQPQALTGLRGMTG